ncbi:helix-turn-helix domain-containing protein, partial [Pseudomonas chlororaphis]|uniref:helix-turn-helix domain-containing protein n=1 Tax=Pseudomonas chlororaphis TaxID=587753 RepID=UPI0011CE56D0
DLANSIGCSQSYITKVIKGDANFTIETMVKISRALESKLCIHLAGIDDQIRWMGVVDSRSAPRKPKTASHWAGVETAPSKVRRSVSHA